MSAPDTFAKVHLYLTHCLTIESRVAQLLWNLATESINNESQELCYTTKRAGLDGIAKFCKASVKMYIFL